MNSKQLTDENLLALLSDEKFLAFMADEELSAISKERAILRKKLNLIDKKRKAMQKHKDGKCLTFEETAFAIWDIDKETRPMSPMGICKLQKRILEKCNGKLSKVGIKSSDDVFEPKDREVAKKMTTVNVS